MFITTKGKQISCIGKLLFSPSKFQYNFSNLKDRLSLLREDSHSSIAQLYSDLRNFQSKLSYNDWVKFKKLIHETDKKVRRLNRASLQRQDSQKLEFPQVTYILDGSITSEYFYHKHTQSLFYKDQIAYHKLGEQKPVIKTIPLNQVKKLVERYLSEDMEPYLFQIIPFEEKYQQLLKLTALRYEAIEEILCRYIFQGYTEFSHEQENLFFKTEQKYKGNFKFQPIDITLEENKPIVETFSLIAKKLACLNQCRPKIQLAVEMLLSQNWMNLSVSTLSNLLFCTSANGKDLHQISTNIDQISQRLLSNDNKEFFNLLFYMCIAGLQNSHVFQQADRQLKKVSESLNSFEKLIFSAMVPYLSQVRQVDFVQIAKNSLGSYRGQQNSGSDCLQSFKKFLSQRQYQYDIIPSTDVANIIAPYQMVEIEHKKFVCYSALFFQPEQSSNTPAGLGKLVNEYFKGSGEKIKVINGKKLATVEKWSQKQEYLKTKMQGLTKPQIKRQKKFEFYSPRQDYFDQKQQK